MRLTPPRCLFDCILLSVVRRFALPVACRPWAVQRLICLRPTHVPRGGEANARSLPGTNAAQVKTGELSRTFESRSEQRGSPRD